METNTTTPAPAPQGRLATGKLGTFDIVFFVMSAAAPLTVAISSAPMSFRVGGIGAPGAMLLSGVVLILFAIGFTAMSRFVRNSGAFYAYAAAGLGKPIGIGVSFVTIVAYAFLCFCFYALLGFFANLTLGHLFGIDVHWGVWACVSVLLIGVLGYRRIDVGARVLAVLLTAEVAILVVVGVAILLTSSDNIPAASAVAFHPDHVLFATGASALFVFGFGAFLGFEGTVIYAEEAKNPDRTVPRATYIAITFLALFYAFTFWSLTVSFGPEGMIAMAQAENFEEMTFIAGGNALGAWAVIVLEILIVTSFFACTLAFHNACSRYLFSLGREGLLPKPLARTHHTMASPHLASLTLTIISFAGIFIGAVSGADPFLGIALWTYSIGVAGLIFSQGVAAVSVIGFFWGNRRGHSVWRVLIAPIIGALGLGTAFTVIAMNFDLVSGVEGPINAVLLVSVPLIFGVGITMGVIMKQRAPQRYAELTQSVNVITAEEAHAQHHVNT